MLQSYKGRTVEQGQKVKVYYNLHNGLWSIMDYKTERVLCHADSVSLDDVFFNVRQGGREKVLQERKKNVHAFVCGYFKGHGVDVVDYMDYEFSGAYYNPYEVDRFVDIDSKEAITGTTLAVMTDEKRAYYVV